MIRYTWGESGKNLVFGFVSKWLKVLRSLVIPPRLERGTYCLEGRFRIKTRLPSTPEKSSICAFSLWKWEYRLSSYLQLFTVKLADIWEESGKFAFLNPIYPIGKMTQQSSRLSSADSFANFNYDIKTTTRRISGGKIYGKAVHGYE